MIKWLALIGIICLVFPLAFVFTSSVAAKVAVIQVTYREAAELLPLVQALLSPTGRATADVQSNSLVVIDHEESLAKIEAFIASVDKPAQQLKIRFRFQEEIVSNKREISAGGRFSRKGMDVSIGEGSDEGVHLRARSSGLQNRQVLESFISVTSGGTAYISVAKDIPFTQQWIDLTRRYARIAETVEFRRIETGFEVQPFMAGDLVRIKIVPVISSFQDGERGVVRLVEASTEVAVVRGEWTTVAGGNEATREAIKAILSSGSSTAHSVYSIAVLVE